MTLKAALRWSLYDRALALGPLLLGLAVAGVGLYIGAGVYLEELLYGDPSDATSPASTPIAAVGVVLGVVVWQVGRGAVRHYTLQSADLDAGASGRGDARATDPSAPVRESIADLENDVEALGRKTTRLEQELHGQALGTDALETSTPEPDTGSATESGAAGGAGGASSSSDAAAGAGDDWPGAGGGAPDRSDATGQETAPEEGADAAGIEASGAEAGSADAGRAAADDDTDEDDADAEEDSEGFEWEGEAEDGEYYRNT